MKAIKVTAMLVLLGLLAAPTLAAAPWNFSIGTSTLGGSFYIMGPRSRR